MDERFAHSTTVLIPCYNYGRFIGECLRSVLGQTWHEAILEVIVIDDASTDETAEVVAGFSDQRIKYVRNAHTMGICHNLSLGLRIARGQYFARIDADDRWRPNFLEKTLGAFVSYPGIVGVYGDVARMDISGRIVEEVWREIPTRQYFSRPHVGNHFLVNIQENVVPSAAVIGLTAKWRRGAPIPHWFRYESPSDMWLNLNLMRGSQMYYMREVLADYRIHPENLHRQAASLEVMEETISRMIGWWSSLPEYKGRTKKLVRLVRARMHLSLANIAFEREMRGTALNHYARVALCCPRYLFKDGVLRHALSCFIPVSVYTGLKKFYYRFA